MSTQTLSRFTVITNGEAEEFSFDPQNDEQVAAAREKFGELRGSGHLAVKTDGDDTPIEGVNEFNPEDEHVVFSRPFVGG